MRKTTVIVYLENFCRVRTYSWTGKLIWPLCDRYLVQWAATAKETRPWKREYVGTMI